MSFHSFSPRSVSWSFPLERSDCGVALTNGRQGVMIWGDQTLNLSVAHAELCDQRGGGHALAPHLPPRPFQIGGARLEFRFEGDFLPVQAELFLETGIVEITLKNPVGATRVIAIQQHMDEDVCWIEGAADAQIRVRPSWEWVGGQLEAWGYSEPENIEIDAGGGFIQDVPENEALALVWRRRDEQILIATAIDGDPEEAAKTAVTLARQLPQTDTQFFWKIYWRDVPSVRLPDERLQKLSELALFKQAGMTKPNAGVSPLQGPWMEEHRLPPWKND